MPHHWPICLAAASRRNQLRCIHRDCIRCPDPARRRSIRMHRWRRCLFSLRNRLGTSPCRCCCSRSRRHNRTTNTARWTCMKIHCSSYIGSSHHKRRRGNRCRDRCRTRLNRRLHPRRCLFSQRYRPCTCCRTFGRNSTRRHNIPWDTENPSYTPLPMQSELSPPLDQSSPARAAPSLPPTRRHPNHVRTHHRFHPFPPDLLLRLEGPRDYTRRRGSPRRRPRYSSQAPKGCVVCHIS